MKNEKKKRSVLQIRSATAYELFCAYYEQLGVYPTLEQLSDAMAEVTGYCSVNSARVYLMELSRQGLVVYIPGRVTPFRLTDIKQNEILSAKKK